MSSSSYDWRDLSAHGWMQPASAVADAWAPIYIIRRRRFFMFISHHHLVIFRLLLMCVFSRSLPFAPCKMP